MTPRRIILTIIALLVFGTAYSVYDRFLGWIDGLPVLPAGMLAKGDNQFRPPARATSPTIERLREAFGEHSPEAETAFYPTQLEFISGDTHMVLAAGPPPSHPGSNRVPLEPFSVAVFGKPKPEHLRQPGEVAQITTIHSDKAILEFDKPIMTPTDMQSSKLVRLELYSDPDLSGANPLEEDHRKGHVYVIDNQHSADRDRRLVLKTVGPVFYQDTSVFVLTDRAFAEIRHSRVPEAVASKLRPIEDRELARGDFMRELTARLGEKDTDRWKASILGPASTSPTGPRRRGPDMWTDAAIEVVDHSNVPRRTGTPAATAPMASEEARNSATVAAILSGQRLPPPTVTAVGMRVFLVAADSSKDNNKKGTGNLSGLRRIELLEQVTMHLWMEGGQGLVGAEGKSSAAPELPAATAAVTGGLAPAAAAVRELGRDLLQIETRGPFAFDSEKNIARFDALMQTDPALTNDVRATKVQFRPGLQTLFSQVLEIEFNGSPLGSSDAPPQTPPPRPGVKAAAGKEPAKPASGPQFKRLHAWSTGPDRLLTILSDAEQLQAYGQDLVRVQATATAPESTQLIGSPLFAVQQGSALTAGTREVAGILFIESAVAGGTDRKTTIRGPGRIEMWDAAAKANTMAASWLTSMVQTKERVNNRELDLYTFTDGAKLEDLQSDYQLKGNQIKMWMAPTAPGKEPAPPSTSSGPASPASRSQLDKLFAVGDVTMHSGDLDIEHTNSLVAFFRDIPTPETLTGGGGQAPVGGGKQDPNLPKEPANPADVQAAGPMGPMGPMGPNSSADPPEPQKPKPPMKIKANTIDTWVVRYPQPKLPAPVGKSPASPGKPPPAGQNAPGETTSGGMKYQLERAWCEGKVEAHQAPDDPSKPRGTDIFGSRMVIDSQPDGSGSLLTVTGWELIPGEVHNEGTSLIGPRILIDQLHNIAVIEGRGTVMLPANSDLAGADKKPDQKDEPVTIHFLDGMKFDGSQKLAQFFGKVNASQGESWITCDTMNVNLDRPVYFSQMNRPAAKPATRTSAKGPAAADADDDKAKIDVIYCYPATDDKAETELEKLVAFCQIERDPATGKLTRKQQLTARELTIRAQVKDENRSEPYRLVLGEGPELSGMWAPESKEDDSAQKPPGAPPAPAEVEMKLTVVHFTGRMIAKDKGDAFKEATFYDNIHVVNLQADNPDMEVNQLRLPPTALKLICRDQLMVWTHKNPRLPDAPAVQFMHARGNAYLQNDRHDGWGEEIRSIGKVVWFDGTKVIPARIKERFGAGDNSGLQIRLDRSSNRYSVDKSSGGQFTEAGGGNDDGLKVLPPPIPPGGPAKPQTPNQKPGGTPATTPGQGQNPNQGNPNQGQYPNN